MTMSTPFFPDASTGSRTRPDKNKAAVKVEASKDTIAARVAAREPTSGKVLGANESEERSGGL